MLSLRTGPLIPAMSLESTRSMTPTPPQFRTGASPLIAELLVMPVVPKVVKNCFRPLLNPSRLARTALITSGVCAMIFFVGFTTMALSFLEPITAPTPERAASRPRSFAMPAMMLSCSPAGPISATLTFLPSSSLNWSSTSIASPPQYCEASRSSSVSSSM